MHQQLESVLEQVRVLSDRRQWEVAEVLLASLNQQSLDVNLSPRKIAKAERDAANYETADDDRFATDEEVRAVFARLTDKGRRRAVFT
jgi:sirohydrochlorin ferrochelatase